MFALRAEMKRKYASRPSSLRIGSALPRLDHWAPQPRQRAPFDLGEQRLQELVHLRGAAQRLEPEPRKTAVGAGKLATFLASAAARQNARTHPHCALPGTPWIVKKKTHYTQAKKKVTTSDTFSQSKGKRTTPRKVKKTTHYTQAKPVPVRFPPAHSAFAAPCGDSGSVDSATFGASAASRPRVSSESPSDLGKGW